MNNEQKMSAYQNSYNAARNEIVERIKLRDQALLLYLAAITTLFGIGLGKDKMAEILFIIPFLALGIVSIIVQHNLTIGAIASFIRTELKEYFLTVPHWDDSKSLKKIFKQQSLFRKISAYITIGVPPIISLIINNIYATQTTFPYGLLWWLCLVLTIISIYYIYITSSKRDKIYEIDFKE